MIFVGERREDRQPARGQRAESKGTGHDGRGQPQRAKGDGRGVAAAAGAFDLLISTVNVTMDWPAWIDTSWTSRSIWVPHRLLR